jgi:lactate dehydrogenase-like 2-hydroxyacid dehydrogenase
MTRNRLLLFAAVPADLRAALAARFELVGFDATVSGAEWAGFNIAITTGMHGASAAEFAACPDLKLLVSQGVGLDMIDLEEARRRNIAVSHTPDELWEDVAEAAIAMTYALLRRVAEADRFVRSGRWGRERIAPSRRVAGKIMGIVGLGKIGRHIARRAEGIGMTVLYHDRFMQSDVPYRFVPAIAALAERADVLALACPGGEATRNLVNAEVLDRLGNNGFLVNVSRGTVVDEDALIEALETKRIAGAALDVFACEPDIDRRLLQMENVVLAPHSSSITQETRAAIIDRMIGDIAAFREGRRFYNAAD